MHGGHGAEHQALLRLIGTLVEDLEPNESGDKQARPVAPDRPDHTAGSIQKKRETGKWLRVSMTCPCGPYPITLPIGWMVFAQLGKTIVDLGRECAKRARPLCQAGQLLTGNGGVGSLGQVLLAFVLLLAGAAGVASLAYLALASERRKLRLISPGFALPSALALLRACIVDAIPAAAYSVAALVGSAVSFSEHGLIFSGTGPSARS